MKIIAKTRIAYLVVPVVNSRARLLTTNIQNKATGTTINVKVMIKDLLLQSCTAVCSRSSQHCQIIYRNKKEPTWPIGHYISILNSNFNWQSSIALLLYQLSHQQATDNMQLNSNKRDHGP